MTADDLVRKLRLEPLPAEGGYFRETYRAEGVTSTQPGKRNLCAVAYYLITPQSFSRLHRLRQDEIWHYHGGGSAEMILLDEPTGRTKTIELGLGRVQAVVPAGIWQGTRLLRGEWALFGLTTSPAFDFDDLKMAPAEMGNKFSDCAPFLP